VIFGTFGSFSETFPVTLPCTQISLAMQSLNMHDPDNEDGDGSIVGSGIASPVESGDEGVCLCYRVRFGFGLGFSLGSVRLQFVFNLILVQVQFGFGSVRDRDRFGIGIGLG
jgi:hypothetical protein